MRAYERRPPRPPHHPHAHALRNRHDRHPSHPIAHIHHTPAKSPQQSPPSRAARMRHPGQSMAIPRGRNPVIGAHIAHNRTYKRIADACMKIVRMLIVRSIIARIITASHTRDRIPTHAQPHPNAAHRCHPRLPLSPPATERSFRTGHPDIHRPRTRKTRPAYEAPPNRAIRRHCLHNRMAPAGSFRPGPCGFSLPTRARTLGAFDHRATSHAIIA